MSAQDLAQLEIKFNSDELANIVDTEGKERGEGGRERERERECREIHVHLHSTVKEPLFIINSSCCDALVDASIYKNLNNILNKNIREVSSG